jgi:CheY-like chemotaxis protein
VKEPSSRSFYLFLKTLVEDRMLKKRILLAEDDEDDQEFFRDFIKDREDVILLPMAQNGMELMEQLENISNPSDLPDFIILDQNMPKQNGLQTLQSLKKDTRYAHIPVVIYSTYTDDSLIKRGAETGACLVLPKPISKLAYDQLVNKVIDSCS